jgi:hypothetical protein
VHSPNHTKSQKQLYTRSKSELNLCLHRSQQWHSVACLYKPCTSWLLQLRNMFQGRRLCAYYFDWPRYIPPLQGGTSRFDSYSIRHHQGTRLNCFLVSLPSLSEESLFENLQGMKCNFLRCLCLNMYLQHTLTVSWQSLLKNIQQSLDHTCRLRSSTIRQSRGNLTKSLFEKPYCHS